MHVSLPNVSNTVAGRRLPFSWDAFWASRESGKVSIFLVWFAACRSMPMSSCQHSHWKRTTVYAKSLLLGHEGQITLNNDRSKAPGAGLSETNLTRR